MKKLIRFTAVGIVLLFLISLYSAAVVKVNNGGTVGMATKPVKYLSEFPSLILRSFKENVEERKTFKPIPVNFSGINKLEEDLWVLRSVAEENDDRKVFIQNLRNDSISNSWLIKGPFENHFRIFNPLPTKDGGLIYNFNANSGLHKINSLGEKIWDADTSLAIHHSLNFDHEGNVWACATPHDGPFISTRSFKTLEELNPVKFRDDYLIKFDQKSGKVLYQKSITQLMEDHNLRHLLFQKSSSLNDPYHLNDIEPVLQDSGFFKKGDILVSIKNSHSILHYRPGNDSIIKCIQGPFTYQHDVDVLDGNRISIFNNNMYPGYKKPLPLPRSFNKKDSVVFNLKGSGVLIYDYNTNKFAELWPHQFKANAISTKTEGLSTFLENGWLLVEEQNSGILWVLSDSAVLYKNIFPSHIEGFMEHLNWTRVIEN